MWYQYPDPSVASAPLPQGAADGAPPATTEPSQPFQFPHVFEFVTGPAGSGKTTLVRQQVEASQGQARLAATTGIAAVNLGDAVTINSILRYFNTAQLREYASTNFLTNRIRWLRNAGIRRLVVDEVSMMEADQLTILVDAIDEVNREASVLAGDEPEFGMSMVGDFLQLPPIDGGYAFESPRWAESFGQHVTKLETIHRQADPLYIAGLRALRIGDGASALSTFKPCMAQSLDKGFDGTTVFATNREVDAHNYRTHQNLPGQFIRFNTKTWGEEHSDWKNIPPVVALKPNALVMCLANGYVDGTLVYANGDLGHFLGVPEGGQNVAVVELLRNNRTVNVEYVTRQNELPTGIKSNDRQVAFKVVGEVDYMPLRLAYGSTVHKTQGLTLDRIQLEISNRFWASPAMLYVGVSRARTLDGLRIVGSPPAFAHRAVFDRRVTQWR